MIAQVGLRLAVVGCSFFTQNRLNAWAETPEVELVAVCDRDPERAEAARERFHATRDYTDAEVMLLVAQRDLVDNTIAVKTHRALLTLAARNGIQTCRAAGLGPIVHNNFRVHTPILAARAAVVEEQFSDPHFAQFSFRSAMTSSPGSPIATEKRFHSHRSRHPHPGRVPCHHGAIENALFASRSGSNPAIVGEDVATIVIRYENGGTRIVDCSYASRRLPKPFPQTMLRIEGGQGTIELLEGFHPRVTSKAEWMNGWSSPQSQPGRSSPCMSWRAC